MQLISKWTQSRKKKDSPSNSNPKTGNNYIKKLSQIQQKKRQNCFKKATRNLQDKARLAWKTNQRLIVKINTSS